MGYIFGIVGVVSVGSVFCGILYYLFNSRSNLEDANANYREDRRFGNYDLEDDDDDSVEVFSDIVSITNELRNMDFDDTITDFNKFTARRSSNNNTSNFEDTAAQTVVTETQQPVAIPQAQVQQVEQPVLKPITTDELYSQINDDFDDGIEEL
jgi:hypothetical protein